MLGDCRSQITPAHFTALKNLPVSSRPIPARLWSLKTKKEKKNLVCYLDHVHDDVDNMIATGVYIYEIFLTSASGEPFY